MGCRVEREEEGKRERERERETVKEEEEEEEEEEEGEEEEAKRRLLRRVLIVALWAAHCNWVPSFVCRLDGRLTPLPGRLSTKRIFKRILKPSVCVCVSVSGCARMCVCVSTLFVFVWFLLLCFCFQVWDNGIKGIGNPGQIASRWRQNSHCAAVGIPVNP